MARQRQSGLGYACVYNPWRFRTVIQVFQENDG